MRFLGVFAFILFSLMSVGCGPSGSSEFQQRWNWRPSDEVDTPEFKSKLKFPLGNQSGPLVVCEDPSNCPKNVGIVIGRNYLGDEGAYQCTGSLIRNDTVLTNSHCLPEGLVAGDACEGLLMVSFPADSDGRIVSVDCKSILYRSSDLDSNQLNHTDIGIFRIPKVQIEPLTLGSEGIGQEKEYRALKVDPIREPSAESSARGILRPTPCWPSFESIVFPELNGARSISFVLVGCEVIGGNSGSPIVDERGVVQGVLNSRFPKDRVSELLAILPYDSEIGRPTPTKNWALISDKPQLSFGSNLSCLNVDENQFQFSLTSRCQSSDRVRAKELTASLVLAEAELAAINIQSDVRTQAASMTNMCSSTISDRFRLGLVWLKYLPKEMNSKSPMIAAGPRCYIADRSGWLAEPLSGDLEVPTWTSGLTVDFKLGLKYAPRPVLRKMSYEIISKPGLLGGVKYEIQLLDFMGTTRAQYKLPACTKEEIQAPNLFDQETI